MMEFIKEDFTITKFTQKIADTLVEYHSGGLNIEDCARLCGISPPTLYRWLKKGKEAKRNTRYKKFYTAFEKARIKNKAYHLKKVQEDKSWQSSAWYLERVWAEEYSSKVHITHNGNLNMNNPFEDLETYKKKSEANEIEELDNELADLDLDSNENY